MWAKIHEKNIRYDIPYLAKFFTHFKGGVPIIKNANRAKVHISLISELSLSLLFMAGVTLPVL
jgi:hypothetical protein